MHNTWLTHKFDVTLSNVCILPSVVKMFIKQQILFKKMMCPIWCSLLLILICLIRTHKWKVWSLKYSIVLVIVCWYLIWHNVCGEAQFVAGWCWMEVSYQETVLRYLNPEVQLQDTMSVQQLQILWRNLLLIVQHSDSPRWLTRTSYPRRLLWEPGIMHCQIHLDSWLYAQKNHSGLSFEAEMPNIPETKSWLFRSLSWVMVLIRCMKNSASLLFSYTLISFPRKL